MIEISGGIGQNVNGKALSNKCKFAFGTMVKPKMHGAG
jgi:hypothetical protein